MNYTVSVNGNKIPVFEENIYPMPYNSHTKMECVSFVMEEKVQITIKSAFEIKSVIIRPLSAKIKHILQNGDILITLDKPQKFSVEINGDYNNNLIVFAEADKYKNFNPSSENIMYFKKGTHELDLINITDDNTTVYLEEGATLYGNIHAENCNNLKIFGYGKITMERIPRDGTRFYALQLLNCKNVEVKDIMITDSCSWTFKVSGCDDVLIDNVKIIGSRGNSDGIDVCGSRNVTVQNIFTRTWDDSFVVKALDTGNLENIVYKDSILWNDFARPIEIGVEVRAEYARNIMFDNIDIIHSPTGYPLMGIHHGDRAKIRNITFKNIRIEDTPGAQLFDIRITNSVWNKDKDMGDIDGVTIQNISYIGKPGMDFSLSKSRLQGYDKDHSIRNVTIDNIQLLGKTATSLDNTGINVMDFVEGVNFVSPQSSKNPISEIKTKIVITEPFKENGKGTYNGKVKIIAKNCSEKQCSGKAWLLVSPVNTANPFDSDLFFDLAPQEEIEREYALSLQSGKYLLSVQSDSVDVNCDRMLVELDLLLSESEKEADMKQLEFHNYYNTTAAPIKIGTYNNRLLIKTDILKTSSLFVYAAMPVEDNDGQIKFSVEETDFGEVPAMLLGRHGLEEAPQLRCPAEITYVFENEPKVEKIVKIEVQPNEKGIAELDFEELGISGKHFWLEISANLEEVKDYRYPYSLFHSVKPEEIAHMFANVQVL